VLSAAFGITPRPLLWASSGIALLSTLLVTADQMDGSGAISMHSVDSLISNVSLGE